MKAVEEGERIGIYTNILYTVCIKFVHLCVCEQSFLIFTTSQCSWFALFYIVIFLAIISFEFRFVKEMLD